MPNFLSIASAASQSVDSFNTEFDAPQVSPDWPYVVPVRAVTARGRAGASARHAVLRSNLERQEGLQGDTELAVDRVYIPTVSPATAV